MASDGKRVDIAVTLSHVDLPRSAAIGAGVYAVVAGTVTLLGWTLNSPRLADWIGSGIAMFPNTAVCATLSGVALILLASSSGHEFRRWVLRALAFAVALIGGLTLFQHISGTNLGIDTLLFEGRWGQRAAASANRMGPPASTSFLILGTALILATSTPRGRRFASAVATLPVAIASLSLIGYWFGSDQLYTIVHLTGIAFQTSTVIAVLGLGVMAGIPEYGLVALLSRDDAGGMLVRRVLLPVVVIPLLLGWLLLLGEEAGYYDTGFGLSMGLLTAIAMLLILLTWTALGISRAAQIAKQSQSELEAVLRRDIADRKRAENELRQAEERMRSVVDHVVDGIITIDERGNIESFNPAAEKIFGYQRGDVIGRNVKLLMPEPYHTQHDGYLHNYLTTGQAKIIGIGREVLGKRKDGSTFPMELAVSTFHIASRRFFTGIVRDITERKQLEEQLRQRVEDLAAADSRKDEFLAMLAHELRNPLAPIRTGLEVIKLAKGDAQTVEEVQRTMERQVLQLITLVDDLLDVSRITQGKLRLRKRNVSLAEVVQSALEASRAFIEEAGHELSVAVPEPSITIQADPYRLAQILSNLLNNAAKYTPAGGQIWLAAEQQGSDILLTVKDTGIGIPLDMQDHIFEMFAQLDQPPEKGHTGLGIGLTLVKTLVEMHGGRIAIHSEGPGRGSEFSVRLPIFVEPCLSEPQLPEDQPAAASGLRVLVVDDNKAAADLLSMAIKMLGNEVRISYNGLHGIEAAAEFLPDVILMDIGMPGMDGYEAAQNIRQQPWGKTMILVAVTGWGQDDDKQRTAASGFDYHLVKPADPGELRRLLSAVAAEKNPLII